MCETVCISCTSTSDYTLDSEVSRALYCRTIPCLPTAQSVPSRSSVCMAVNSMLELCPSDGICDSPCLLYAGCTALGERDEMVEIAMGTVPMLYYKCNRDLHIGVRLLVGI